MTSPSRSARARVALAVAIALVAARPLLAAAAPAVPESVEVPLHVLLVRPDVTKIGIEVALGGGPPRLYELDTGASGFYAASDASSWPSYEPLGERITQRYGSGVQFDAERVRTTVAIPSRQGPIATQVAVARIVDAFGGPLGPRDEATWQDDVARGDGPLYGRFFGNFGGDLRMKDGLASVLPQLPGNLASGFVIELGCERAGGPRLVIGLTAAQRARFTTKVAMRPGSGGTFPHSGLPTYAQTLLAARFHLAHGDATQTFTADALLDTGGPTTSIHQADGLEIHRALVDERRHIVKPGTRVWIGDQQADAGRLDLTFAAGTVAGRNRVDVKRGGEADVNLGLIPFFRYDVLFDVANGVLGFAPCRNDA